LNKRNYRQAKRQREVVKKTRQQEKQQRRSERTTPDGDAVGDALIAESPDPGNPVDRVPEPESGAQ
jgi:hypothetical protein